ncbi:MAG TPA: metallophosphoesterase family protein [Solirubrobacteraceae bacterium]|nr:metallophosphoesterase family protein [Solirubrobacteraceae bacterium]
MRVAIITDVHANRQALEAVLEAIGASDCESTWCLGDVVGYGADPDACAELIREHAAICLAGNHDLAVTGALSAEDFSEIARRAAEWTASVISPETRRFLELLEPRDESQLVSLYHASARDPVWEYVLSPLQADLTFEVAPARVSVVGHTHVALAFHRFDGEVATGETRHAEDELDLSQGYWLLNPGSVGQPRDGDSRAAWLELDTEAWTAHWRRTEYDIEGAAWAIRAARLPEPLAERLSFGQ